MPKGSHGKSSTETQDLFLNVVGVELERVKAVLGADAVRQGVEETYDKLETAISTDSDEWKTLIPGKPVLATFANQVGLSPGRAKSLYISAVAEVDRNPFEEIETIFEQMSGNHANGGEAEPIETPPMAVAQSSSE